MFSDDQTEIDKQTDETNLELFFYHTWVNFFRRAIIIPPPPPPPPRKFCLWFHNVRASVRPGRNVLFPKYLAAFWNFIKPCKCIHTF